MNAQRRTIGSDGLSAWLLAAACFLGAGGVCWAAEPSPAATHVTKPGQIEKQIRQLIAQLGDKDYGVRQRAQEELSKLGFLAFDALNAASNHEDFEIASRARYLLRVIRSQWATEKDPPEARRLLEGYELLQTEQRAWRITRLVRLPASGGIPVVCRLIRFERSSMLASHAAVEILQHEPMDRATWERLAESLREHLAGSQRRPARWLTTYVALRQQPSAALQSWSKLVEEEQKVLRTHPEQTVRGAAPLLTYLLAEAEARSGQQAKADRTAQGARQLGGSTEPAQLRVRLQTALALRRRGLFSWAEAEYLHVAEVGSIIDRVLALVYLSEMRHDRGESLSAAEARRKAVESIDQLAAPAREQIKEGLSMFGIEAADISARMNYFFACHWETKGDRAKQRQYLKDAVRASAQEVDTLIAMFRLPDQTEEERNRTRVLIDKAVAQLRRDVDESPDDATAFNQLAWLMGNTRRDLDEALRLAKRATELSPDNGAYLDTLAHVYFAKGDFSSAIRCQTRAAEVEPHSGQIVSALKVFRAAAEQKNKEERKKNEKASSTASRKG